LNFSHVSLTAHARAPPHAQDLGKGEEQCFRTRVVLFGDEDKDKLFKAITGRGATAGESLAIATTTLKIKHGLLPAGNPPSSASSS
jgi:predicted secreted Zn-dependent protease